MIEDLHRALSGSTAARLALAVVLSVSVASLLLEPVPLAASPAPSAAPQVRASPESLVVRQEDLPVPFAISGGDDQPGGEYVTIFFRPEILEPPELAEGDLMGVIAAVDVAASPQAAHETFASRTTADSLGEGPTASGAVLTSEQELEARLMGVDEALLFRVEYLLQGVHVIEYRYRLRIANAVANVLISGRAGRGGTEPEGLADQARRIAERQAIRLATARERTP